MGSWFAFLICGCSAAIIKDLICHCCAATVKEAPTLRRQVIDWMRVCQLFCCLNLRMTDMCWSMTHKRGVGFELPKERMLFRWQKTSCLLSLTANGCCLLCCWDGDIWCAAWLIHTETHTLVYMEHERGGKHAQCEGCRPVKLGTLWLQLHFVLVCDTMWLCISVAGYPRATPCHYYWLGCLLDPGTKSVQGLCFPGRTESLLAYIFRPFSKTLSSPNRVRTSCWVGWCLSIVEQCPVAKVFFCTYITPFRHDGDYIEGFCCLGFSQIQLA